MRKATLAFLTFSAIMTHAQTTSPAPVGENPFFSEYTTVYGTIPFSQVKNGFYEEAIDRGIKLQNQEIEAIVNNPEAPTFENTIVALERTGKDLNRVLGTFYPLLSADSDDELMEISLRVSPKLSQHGTGISLNEGLWKRIKSVYDNRKSFNLDSYEIWLTADDLSGLPESSVEAAALAAKDKGREGEYLFTLAQPTYTAFLKYSSRPDLREKFYRLYNSRNTGGEYSNMELIPAIADTRRQIANLFGKSTYAEYALEKTMAENPDNVNSLLNELAEAYRPAQQREFAEIEAYATKLEGRPVKLNAWDYSYYSNKLKESKYDYDEEELRPYFELNNVIDGVFGLATRLYGLQFKYNPDIEVYHPDVKAYEVTESDGKFIGIIYTDFFPRATKRPGAWMTNFREEYVDENGNKVTPQVTIVMNFTKPTDSKPSLLTPYEVETFLHEFGHGLHGLLASTKYSSLSGTNVYRDFVELPSQRFS